MTRGSKNMETRSANDKTLEDDKNKIKIMNEKFQKIDKEIADTGEMDVNDAIKAMYLAFLSTDSPYNIKDMRGKLIEFETRIDEQEKQISSFEKKNCRFGS